MKVNSVAKLGLALSVGLSLSACGGMSQQERERVWIEQHPIHFDSDGQCVEADGEPCDDDPFDLDDLDGDSDHKISSNKPVPKPTKAAVKPTRATVGTVPKKQRG